MKTETELLMIGLVLVVVAAIALSIFNAGQADMAAAQVGAEVAAEKMPEAAVIGGQLSGWALKTLLGIVAVAIGSALVVFIRQWWQSRNSGRPWKKGPNAKWQQEPGPRQMSMESMFQMMMMRELMQQRNSKHQPAAMPADDDLGIEF